MTSRAMQRHQQVAERAGALVTERVRALLETAEARAERIRREAADEAHRLDTRRIQAASRLASQIEGLEDTLGRLRQQMRGEHVVDGSYVEEGRLIEAVPEREGAGPAPPPTATPPPEAAAAAEPPHDVEDPPAEEVEELATEVKDLASEVKDLASTVKERMVEVEERRVEVEQRMAEVEERRAEVEERSAEVEEPTAGAVEEPTAGEVEDPAAAEVEEPTAGEVEEPPTDEVEDPAADEVEDPAADEVEELAHEVEELPPDEVREPTPDEVEELAAELQGLKDEVKDLSPDEKARLAELDVHGEADEPAPEETSSEEAFQPEADPEPSRFSFLRRRESPEGAESTATGPEESLRDQATQEAYACGVCGRGFAGNEEELRSLGWVLSESGQVTCADCHSAGWLPPSK